MPREAISAAADVKEFALNQALGHLAELSLVLADEDREASQHRYRVHPLTRSFVLERIKRDEADEGLFEYRRRGQNWLINFLDQYKDEKLQNYDVLDREIDYILPTIDQALKANDSIAPTLVEYTWEFLVVRGHWAKCAELTEQAWEQTKGLEVPDQHLWLQSHLGWLIWKQQENIDRASTLLQDAESRILDRNSQKLLVNTYVLSYYGQLLLEHENYDLSEKYQHRHLEACRNTGNIRGALIAQYYIGLKEIRTERWKHAEKIYTELANDSFAAGLERSAGYFLRRLGEVLGHTGRVDEAFRALDSANEIFHRWKEPLMQARVDLEKARIILDSYCTEKRKEQTQLFAAFSLGSNALTLYQRLGAPSKDIARAEALLVEIQKCTGDILAADQQKH